MIKLPQNYIYIKISSIPIFRYILITNTVFSLKIPLFIVIFLLEIIKIVFYIDSFSHRIERYFRKRHIRYSVCHNSY